MSNTNKALTTTFVETNHTFSKEYHRRAEDILEDVKATYHLQLFSGVTHGFGTHGDLDQENSHMFYYKSLRIVDYH